MAGGGWNTRREPVHARGEHANSTQKDPSRDLNREYFPVDLHIPHNNIYFCHKDSYQPLKQSWRAEASDATQTLFSPDYLAQML